MGANRVENAIEKWRTKEKRISNIFSFSLSTNTMLKRDKLLFYDKIANVYAGTKNSEERFSLRMLREERRNLERQLYPNRVLRLLRRLIIAAIWVRFSVRREQQKVGEQTRLLQDQIGKAGFEIDSKRIALKVDEGAKNFKLPVEITINDYEIQKNHLRFSMGKDGKYQFDGFQSTVTDSRAPTEIKERFFDAKDKLSFNHKEAYDLLTGRSVKREGKFFQLDFNDRTASGDFRLRESNRRKVDLKGKRNNTAHSKVSLKQTLANKRNGMKMK